MNKIKCDKCDAIFFLSGMKPNSRKQSINIQGKNLDVDILFFKCSVCNTEYIINVSDEDVNKKMVFYHQTISMLQDLQRDTFNQSDYNRLLKRKQKLSKQIQDRQKYLKKYVNQ